MNFLRSVIADARPRKSMPAPWNGPAAIPGRMPPPREGDAFATAKQSPSAPDPKGRLHDPQQPPENVGQSDWGVAQAIQAKFPAGSSVQATGSKVDPFGPPTKSVDNTTPPPVEGGSSRSAPVASPGGASGPHNDIASHGQAGNAHQPPGRDAPDIGIAPSQPPGHDPATASEDKIGDQHRLAGHTVMVPLPSPSAKADKPGKASTDIQDSFLPKVGDDAGRRDRQESAPGPVHGYWSTEKDFDGSYAADDPEPLSQNTSPGPEKFPILENTVSKTALYSPPDDRTIIPGSTAGREKTARTLAHKDNTKPARTGKDNPVEMKDLFNREDMTLVDIRESPFNGSGNKETSSAMKFQPPAQTTSAADPQSPDRRAARPAGSPGSGPLQSDRPVGHIAAAPRPAVPAASIETDLNPPGGDGFHARPPVRLAGKVQAPPKVRIGRIDVIIESPTPSTHAPSPAPAAVDLASRHYLRRL